MPAERSADRARAERFVSMIVLFVTSKTEERRVDFRRDSLSLVGSGRHPYQQSS